MPDNALSIREGMGNEGDPNALIQIMTPVMKKHMKAALTLIEGGLDEEQIREEVRITDKLEYLRVQFWHEVERCYMSVPNTGKPSPFKCSHVWRGVINEKHFFTTISDPKKMAFLLLEPPSMATRNKFLYSKACKKVEEILNADLYVTRINPRTKEEYVELNTEIGKLQVVLWEKLKNRIEGAAPSAPSLHLHAHAKANALPPGQAQIPAIPGALNLDQIQQARALLSGMLPAEQPASLPAADEEEAEFHEVEEGEDDEEDAP